MGGLPAYEALIVAGGLGTRLRPLTTRHPKHLLPVAGVPFVGHQLAKLSQAGIHRAVLATSYRAEEFPRALGDGRAYGLSLEYVTEPVPLGTAGAIRNAAQRLEAGPGEPVVVLNADILSGHDLTAQLALHRSSGADVTLHLVEVADARPFGCVPTDAEGRVTAFVEKSPEPVSRQVNAGCYVVTRSVIDTIPRGRAVSVERETFPALLAAGASLVGYVESAYWLDVGTPASLVEASTDLVRGVVRSPAYPHRPAERRLLPGAQVAPGAVVAGGSTIGAGAVVEADAVVAGSVIGDGVRVGPAARVSASVVGPRARIGAGTLLQDAVVGDDATVGDGCRLPDGVRVECGAEVVDQAVRSSVER